MVQKAILFSAISFFYLGEEGGGGGGRRMSLTREREAPNFSEYDKSVLVFKISGRVE